MVRIAMSFDLLIKGGHVLDPGQGLDGRLDIAITAGRIAAIEPDLSASQALRTVEIRGANRRVVPGLIDLHTHVAYGATTLGVGLDCCEPDQVDVRSGVTTVVDTGSVGVTNIGAFDAHIRPTSRTRIICYVNVGSFALTTSRAADVMDLDEVDPALIARCVEANPGLISGVKLRVTGPFVLEHGEALIRRSKAIAREHHVPFMVHIGNRFADRQRGEALTQYVLETLEPGDIVTHLCTPHPGGILDGNLRPLSAFAEARANGVIMDSALGRHNFSYDIARTQADLGIRPDTISTDITPGGYGEIVQSLMECRSEELGAIAVGREADRSIFDLVSGQWRFIDTVGQVFTGEHAIVPVHTIRGGELIAPNWGPHPWGWLPEQA
jgi:dihydroorotase